MLNNLKIEVSLNPPGADELKGTVILDTNSLNFNCSVSVQVSSNPRNLSVVSIRSIKTKLEYFTYMYIGFGNGHCMNWTIYEDPQPLIDFFESIRVELGCDWYLSTSEFNQTEQMDGVG